MQFDIIIIGGGMVGASMACALKTTPYRVALIDASPITLTDDHRLIALSYRSVCLLKNLNIWPNIANYASPIDEIHVSHRKHFGIAQLKAKELNLATLGYVVPAKYLNSALSDALNNTTIIRPATLKKLTQDADLATIEISTPQGEKTLTAKIIIAADGSHSTVRTLLNIPTKTIEYDQSALVTTTQLQRSHNNIAYERFQEVGAIAMLPLCNQYAATIWTDTNKNIQELMQLNEIDFLEKLQKQFGYRLGRFKKVSQRHTYPLQMIKAEKQIDQRVILIGNAAHTLHPIAAQGLNLALYEIATLTECFTQYPINSFSLQNFAIRQQKISLYLSHQLSKIFSYDFFVINATRKFAMISFDLCKNLKEEFARYVIGQSNQVPPLLMEQEMHESQHT